MTSSSSSQSWPDRSDGTNPDAEAVRYPTGQLSMVPALSPPSDPTKETPPGGRARYLAPDASSMRDLAYATGLLEASERMHSQPDLTALLHLVVAEASTIIASDCAAIVRFAGIRRRVVDTYLGTASDDQRLAGRIRTVADAGWLIKPGHVADLTTDTRWIGEATHWAGPSWRSLMIVPLDSPDRTNQTRLVWFSHRPQHFAARTDVADLFGRHASLAIRHVAALTCRN